MKWRNEQMYHLRQDRPLTKEAQDAYFEKVVSNLFDNGSPEQLLFSFLKNDECMGYGGLVHINWVDKNAEISFIMATELEKEHFHFHWKTFLGLVEEVAFKELKLHKLYIYAFDLRPHLYEAVEQNDYFLDARLKQHCLFDNNFIDVVIHSKLNSI
jgi:RimJ/RimL family protein N-acetyltransferase